MARAVYWLSPPTGRTHKPDSIDLLLRFPADVAAEQLARRRRKLRHHLVPQLRTEASLGVDLERFPISNGELIRLGR